MKITALFHGEKPLSSDITITYYIAVLFAIYVVFNAFLVEANYNLWQFFVLAVIALDLSGGLISNLTKSTKSFYLKRKKLEYFFLIIHFIHPLLLTYTFGLDAAFFFYAYLFMLFSSLLVLQFRKSNYDLSLALLITCIGITIGFQFLVIPNTLIWFLPLFFLKLIVGFSTKYPLDQS